MKEHPILRKPSPFPLGESPKPKGNLKIVPIAIVLSIILWGTIVWVCDVLLKNW